MRMITPTDQIRRPAATCCGSAISAGGEPTIAIKDYLPPDEVAHAVRVSMLAGRLAVHLGYSAPDRRLIERLAVCHDIGKSRVPAALLSKKDPLTDEEWRCVRTHAAISADILLARGFEPLHAQIVRGHHECVDGTGYPDGLIGCQIMAESQIISVADYYDAITTPRPYRDTHHTPEQALSQISRLSGTKFAPEMVQAIHAVLRTDLAPAPNRPKHMRAPLHTGLFHAAFLLRGGE